MPTRLVIGARVTCPSAYRPPAKLALMVCAAALTLSLCATPLSTRANAAAPGLELSTDTLSAGLQSGVTHVLISIDNPAAMIASQNSASTYAVTNTAADTAPYAGFDAASVDPAAVSFGAILQTGIASWYGSAWRGRRTANGTRFNPEAMTAASHTLPLGTRVLVTLEGTARSVLVTITDRQGAARRIIDLSKAAARKLGLLGRGTARVVLRRA
jgi:rare lipoprotein A